MTYLTTGYPLLDLGIALAIGYFIAWFFLARPLSRQQEDDISRTIDTDTELRTSHRELNRVRSEVKELQTKVVEEEKEATVAQNQLIQAQNDLHTVLEEKRGLVTQLEERAATIVLLQSQAEKHDLDAKMAAAQLENLKLRANLAIVTAENDSMKARISVINMENQMLRIPTNMQAHQETPLPNFMSTARHTQDGSVSDNQWLHSNLAADPNSPTTPHFVVNPSVPEGHQTDSESK